MIRLTQWGSVPGRKHYCPPQANKEATNKCNDTFDVQAQPSAALWTTEGWEVRLGVTSLGIDSQEEVPDGESGI